MCPITTGGGSWFHQLHQPWSMLSAMIPEKPPKSHPGGPASELSVVLLLGPVRACQANSVCLPPNRRLSGFQSLPVRHASDLYPWLRIQLSRFSGLYKSDMLRRLLSNPADAVSAASLTICWSHSTFFGPEAMCPSSFRNGCSEFKISSRRRRLSLRTKCAPEPSEQRWQYTMPMFSPGKARRSRWMKRLWLFSGPWKYG